MYVQTDAILQKLGKRFNYLPTKDPIKFQKILAICGAIKDVSEIMVSIVYKKF